MDKQVLALISVVVLIVILCLIAYINNPTNPSLLNQNRWYGKMLCNTCNYRWQSRKKTPPAQCPNCRSKVISQELG